MPRIVKKLHCVACGEFLPNRKIQEKDFNERNMHVTKCFPHYIRKINNGLEVLNPYDLYTGDFIHYEKINGEYVEVGRTPYEVWKAKKEAMKNIMQ